MHEHSSGEDRLCEVLAPHPGTFARCEGGNPEETLANFLALERRQPLPFPREMADHVAGPFAASAGGEWMVENALPDACLKRVVTVQVGSVADQALVYQDGTVVQEPEITLYHGTRPGLLGPILDTGLKCSIRSHGAQGAWVHAVESSAFAWGRMPLEMFSGCVLHVRCPATIGQGQALVQNQEIRGAGKEGHCQFVVSGPAEGSTALRCRITAVSLELPTREQQQWTASLIHAIQECSW